MVDAVEACIFDFEGIVGYEANMSVIVMWIIRVCRFNIVIY